MGNIVLLDDLTINKIAAGEVIERPASVVKEMVENSIDAGATNITVEIKNGGISFIKIADNGKGIAADDIEIAFERHATSKIRSAEDLNTVTSMGFRGEALASVAAVANVEMISKTNEQTIGNKIVVEAGNVLQKEEIACSTGTTITVKNLFFNTPVRYKFLKKDYTESGYIEDAITRIALVHPEIAIKLINEKKTVIQTSGSGNLRDVIYSIFGKDVANGVLKVEYQYEDIKITGVVGKPEIARSNRSNQQFFVNKRYIKDKTLSAATEQAYKGLIPIGKFGFVVLNVEVNPAKLDVNVHPAKLEVRFEEENKIFQAIYHAIKDTLLKSELVANPENKLEENILNNRSLAFEKRLKEIQKGKKESGLFGFRKQNEKQIEKYTDEESKIKTNNILEDIYNEKNEEDTKISIEKEKIGEPVNTASVLEQLKKMKQQLENELLEKNIVPATFASKEQEKQESIAELKEQEKQEPIIELKEQEGQEPSTELKEQEKQETKAQDNQESIIELKENKEETSKQEENTKEMSSEKIEENIKTEPVKIENNEEITYIKEDENNKDEEKSDKVIELKEEDEKYETQGKEKKLEEINEEIKKLETNPQSISDNFDEMYKKLFGRAPITEQNKEEKQETKEEKTSAIDIAKDNISMFEKEEFKKPEYKFIGIVFKTYIILEIEQEMYILDQHAAHERIMYEKVKNNYYSDTSKDSQMLLLPDIITLSHKEMAIAKDNIKMFRQAGFDLEEFGENTIKLTGVPTICIDLDTKELFLETLDEINTVARTAKQEKEEKFIATVACKAAVKANMALNEQEVQSLMDKLLELPNPFTCPHGRPTAIKMTKYDIERKFARK